MENLKIWKENYAVMNSKRIYEDAFANIDDGKELTVIIEQNKINEKDIIEIEKDWRLITFDVKLDFNLVGFIFQISSALAEVNISIFVISSYSTDHIMVKKKDLDKIIKILKNLKINAK